MTQNLQKFHFDIVHTRLTFKVIITVPTAFLKFSPNFLKRTEHIQRLIPIHFTDRLLKISINSI